MAYSALLLSTWTRADPVHIGRFFFNKDVAVDSIFFNISEKYPRTRNARYDLYQVYLLGENLEMDSFSGACRSIGGYEMKDRTFRVMITGPKSPCVCGY